MSANARHPAGRDLRELASIASGLSGRSDHEIRRNLESLSRRERKTTAEVLLHLIEVEKRKIFARAGYGSLFDYCTRGLRYSESAAGRRIRAARCLRNHPQVLTMLCAGEVNVCSLSAVAGVIDGRNCRKLLRAIRGKSKREIDRVVAELGKPVQVRDRVRPVRVAAKRTVNDSETKQGGLLKVSTMPTGGSDPRPARGYIDCSNRPMFDRRSGGRGLITSAPSGTPQRNPAENMEKENTQELEKAPSAKQTYKIEFAADEEFVAKMEKVRARLSGSFPKGVSLEKLFETLMDQFLERTEPDRRAERRAKRRAEKKAGKTGPDGERRRADGAEGGMGIAKRRATPRAGKQAGKEEASGARRYAAGADRDMDGGNRGGGGRERMAGSPAVAAGRHNRPAPGSSVARDGELASPRQRNRHIPARVRDEVHARDGGRCTYIAPDGTRCDSTWDLEIDHIHPFALGGDHSPDNLRLLCAVHNRLEAEARFGAHGGG